MMKYYQNEELCKKPEVSIFENMAMILEKPVFRGWYPLIYALREVRSIWLTRNKLVEHK